VNSDMHDFFGMQNSLPQRVGMIGGLSIFENATLTEDGEPYEHPRTWKERLFTRPWRPLKATRTVIPQVPMKTVFKTQFGLVMHPETAKAMKSVIALA
jgi:hypothetical protein